MCRLFYFLRQGVIMTYLLIASLDWYNHYDRLHTCVYLHGQILLLCDFTCSFGFYLGEVKWNTSWENKIIPSLCMHHNHAFLMKLQDAGALIWSSKHNTLSVKHIKCLGNTMWHLPSTVQGWCNILFSKSEDSTTKRNKLQSWLLSHKGVADNQQLKRSDCIYAPVGNISFLRHCF